ncbi:MAG: YdcF family protein [Candidatus Omnitrophica bacterium]|nr:YdcF family protein [Candidatus Omnitrophota bacterium]
MLHGKNIICISSIDWDFIWQGHQEIMSVLAKNGNRVLFIENTGVRIPTIKDTDRLWKRFSNWKKGYKGIRKLRDNLYVYSPLVAPFPYLKPAIKLNKFLMLSVIKRWMKVMEFHDPVVWTFLPTPLVLDMVDELDPSIFIYYCIDDFSSSSEGARGIKKIERKVFKRADLVFVTSHKLYEYAASENKETHLFPFGVSVDNYNKARESDTAIPAEMRDIKKPIIGYVGGIHKWVDMELVKKIAIARKDLSVVLIGPKQTDLYGIDKLDNVFMLGKKEPKDLPKFVKFFDAGIIPYRKTSYTENVYPTKINEYLAMGKPVISTEIPEVLRFDKENGGDFIYFLKDKKDINPVIDRALGENSSLRNPKRIKVANQNSWLVKIEGMCGLIENKLKNIELQIGRDWLGRFKGFYARARKKAILVVGAVAIMYFVIFYSPLVWLLAAPLEIFDSPQKADAIVVLGGGVGETGSPGKSTIERAMFSAELYKKGLAEYMIYSSGYTWKYNDAESMMQLAVSMGVPKKNIILEKKGDFTYTNIEYTTEILRKKNLHKILLVSSSYNMRRASLVYEHIAKDINVTYVPVPNPQFYQREKKVRLEQIKAIVHEYLGIIYYYLKGYI